MNNPHLNKPLYPPNSFPNENEEKKENTSSFSNLFSSLGQGNYPLLSLLLGMKGGKMPDLSSILSKNGNPLFDTLASFTKSENKKESTSSPKNIPEDEVIN